MPGRTLGISPDKATYRPGEVVTLTLTCPDGGVRGRKAGVLISYLTGPVARMGFPLDEGETQISWQPPAHAPRGYGVDALLFDADGDVVDRASTAFDVLASWTQHPRYGFLTDFAPGRDDVGATIAGLSAYHVNGLQFYDWMYRHHDLLPPDGQDIFVDPLGRMLSMGTVRAFVEAAHAHNVAAMPYTAIYGAAPEFARQQPGGVLYDADGQPLDFADGFLMLMNPSADSSWTAHLMGEFADVLDHTAFDGLHIDQYGEEHTGATAYDADGHPVDVAAAFVEAVTRARTLARRIAPGRDAVVFNCVGNWPIERIAPLDVSFLYIELWPPDITFAALKRVISGVQRLGGGKPVVLAAYTRPAYAVSVRLMTAAIFASGGTHIALGERGGWLADPYFPKYESIPLALGGWLRRAYDVAVRYENALACATRSADYPTVVEGASASADLTPGAVGVVWREGAERLTLSLINLLGVQEARWTEPQPTPPIPQHDLHLTVTLPRPVRSVWWASPDDAPSAHPLDFTAQPGRDGTTTVRFTVPSLAYWTLIVFEASQPGDA